MTRDPTNHPAGQAAQDMHDTAGQLYERAEAERASGNEAAAEKTEAEARKLDDAGITLGTLDAMIKP